MAQPQLNVLGSKVTVKVPSEETGDAYALSKSLDPTGASSPPHDNTRETLTITAVEGDVEVSLPERSVRLGPGESLTISPGTRHATRNTHSAPSRTLYTFVPGGFERFFGEVAALGDAPSLDRVAQIAGAYGIEIAPPEEG